MRLAVPASRVLLVALLSVIARAGGAQEAPAPSPDLAAAIGTVSVGATIRLRTRELPTYGIAGMLQAHVPGGVRLLANGEPHDVSFGDIRAAEMHVGRRDAGEAFGRGALRGFVVGAVIGTTATLVMYQHERRNGCGDCFIPATAVVGAGSVLLTVATTGIGGLVGLARRDRWKRVWPPER